MVEKIDYYGNDDDDDGIKVEIFFPCKIDKYQIEESLCS